MLLAVVRLFGPGAVAREHAIILLVGVTAVLIVGILVLVQLGAMRLLCQLLNLRAYVCMCVCTRWLQQSTEGLPAAPLWQSVPRHEHLCSAATPALPRLHTFRQPLPALDKALNFDLFKHIRTSMEATW